MSSGLDLTLLSTYFVLKSKILSIEIKTILRYTILIHKVDKYVLGLGIFGSWVPDFYVITALAAQNCSKYIVL